TVIYLYIAGEVLEVTPEHPFLVNGEWLTADKLTTYHSLTLHDGTTTPIEKIETITLATPKKVYNFAVQGYNSYFVGESRVLVHNCEIPANRLNLSNFETPKTLISAKGISGKFSKKGYEYRIDTNKITPGEGGFHIHIYKDGKEVAKVMGTGGWSKGHRGNTLLKPSEIDSEVKKEINKLVNATQKAVKNRQ
ncbi:polymorphic toxin-type HINT domain-containing protein, partial [Flavobacterium branchiophilum]